VKVIKSKLTSGGPDRFIPEDWAGALQSHAYELYASLAQEPPRITQFGCVTHFRRKIVDAIKAGDADAIPFFDLIAQLYAIEKDATARGLGDAQRG